MKLLTLLRLSGLPFQTVTQGLRGAPKGKLPHISDDGIVIADSTLIRWHIEQKYGIDFDHELSSEARAQAWAFEKLCEDNIYFAVLRARWLDDANFVRGPAKFFEAAPAPIRPLVSAMVRRGMRRSLHLQGTGRHSTAESERIAIRGIDALATQIGEKPWLVAEQPCGADATVHAFVTGLLCPVFETPLRQATESHPNLVAYSRRGLQKWYPEFAS